MRRAFVVGNRRIVIQKRRGWHVIDTSGVTHWASDKAVDGTVRYLKDIGRYRRTEKAF